jgi:hypothetical protein
MLLKIEELSMETMLVIGLCAAIALLFPRAQEQAAPPQFLIVQTMPTAEPSGQGSGCFFWGMAIFVVLVLLGVIPLA